MLLTINQKPPVQSSPATCVCYWQKAHFKRFKRLKRFYHKAKWSFTQLKFGEPHSVGSHLKYWQPCMEQGAYSSFKKLSGMVWTYGDDGVMHSDCLSSYIVSQKCSNSYLVVQNSTFYYKVDYRMLTSKVYGSVLVWEYQITIFTHNQGTIEVFSNIDCWSWCNGCTWHHLCDSKLKGKSDCGWILGNRSWEMLRDGISHQCSREETVDLNSTVSPGHGFSTLDCNWAPETENGQHFHLETTHKKLAFICG